MDHFRILHHYLFVNIASRQIHQSFCHCNTHTHTNTSATTALLFFPPPSFLLEYKSQHSAGAHTHIPRINSVQWASSQLVQCSRLSGQCGERVNMLWEKETACRSVSPHAPSLSVAGSRWQGMAARHGSLGCQEMAIIAGTPQLSVPLSPLRKVPFYVLRDIFPKCV